MLKTNLLPEEIITTTGSQHKHTSASADGFQERTACKPHAGLILTLFGRVFHENLILSGCSDTSMRIYLSQLRDRTLMFRVYPSY